MDEFNIIHAAERMARLGAQVRVLMVLADGMTGVARGTGQVGGRRRVERDHRDRDRDRGSHRGRGLSPARGGVSARRPDPSHDQRNQEPLRRSLALWGMDTWWLRASEIKTYQETAVA